MRGASTDSLQVIPPDDLIGRSLGGYVIRREIGRGGMGVVYLGEHPALEKKVAVKVILEHRDEEARQRFFDEARAAAALDHPHVVAVHDLALLPDGRPYMVMEHLDGESVRALLERRGKLPPGEAVAIAAQVLDGLGAAHARGIVHRDVKPANVLLAARRGGVDAMILDFGVAKLHAGGATGTRRGVVLGTPEYMAPEQAAGGVEPIDGRTDLYAVGILLYELLSGRPPFQSEDWTQIILMHRTTPPPPLDGVPDALAAAIGRALAKRPDDRFADAASMREAILGAVDDVGMPAVAGATTAEQPTVRRRRRRPEAPPLVSAVSGRLRSRWWRLAVTGSAALAGALAATLVLTRAGRTPAAQVTSADPAVPGEWCSWEVTAGDGRVHRFGGPRMSDWSKPGALVHSSLTTGTYTLTCTAHSDGDAYSAVTFMVPAARAVPGTQAIAGADTMMNLAFSGLPRAGFVDAAYDSVTWNAAGEGVATGSLTFDAIALTPGTRVAGVAHGTLEPRFTDLNPISIRVEFDFTQ